VDLLQGDYQRETVYDVGAEVVAQQFVDAGARWVHVVDLDGAKAGRPANTQVVEQVARVVAQRGAKLQLGGGIRSLEAARAALNLGASRVVVGTAAVEHPELVQAMVGELGAEAIVVAVDARDGVVATRGWTRGSGERAIGVARRMVSSGVVRLIYTDISRDSMLAGPNFDELRELSQATSAAIIASGGITTVDQVRQLAAMRLEGAIVGSALYAGRITLRDALMAADGEDAQAARTR
jgi:phosphoribosylformimino-5-aminoimidazole carboxamide ribotide isomerase